MTDAFTIIIYSEIGLLFLVMIYAGWMKLGGWPEAWYRIRRTPYFTQHVYQPDRTEYRYVRKMEIILRDNPPRFAAGGKDWSWMDSRVGRDTGRPSIYYNHDDTEPIPIFDWKKPEDKLDPKLIQSAYENDAIERVHKIGLRGTPGWVWIIVAAVLIAVVITIVGAYLSWNTFCAVTPAKCGGVGGVRVG